MRSIKDIIKEIKEIEAKMDRVKSRDISTMSKLELDQAILVTTDAIIRIDELQKEMEMAQKETLKDFIIEVMQESINKIYGVEP